MIDEKQEFYLEIDTAVHMRFWSRSLLQVYDKVPARFLKVTQYDEKLLCFDNPQIILHLVSFW